MTKPIGIFDSGIGGLTVAREIITTLPNEDVIYFGDTARVPYGSKSKETITRFSKEIVEFLLEKGVKLIVVACNTASSNALSELKSVYKNIPFVGVINPGVKKALSVANRVIGIIGTKATIGSGIYSTALGDRYMVIQKACPLLVPIVEEDLVEKPFTEKIVEFYLHSLKRERVDTLILGCTHYPMLKSVIQNAMGSEVKLVDSAVEVARFVRILLNKKDIKNDSRTPKYNFYFSDITGNQNTLVERFLGRKVELSKITLD
ncbi:glutamate racemase [candidate division WOR-3 bacterium]|nr:glutamate racemase [candidate division WOR-3 bacterium]